MIKILHTQIIPLWWDSFLLELLSFIFFWITYSFVGKSILTFGLDIVTFLVFFPFLFFCFCASPFSLTSWVEGGGPGRRRIVTGGGANNKN